MHRSMRAFPSFQTANSSADATSESGLAEFLSQKFGPVRFVKRMRDSVWVGFASNAVALDAEGAGRLQVMGNNFQVSLMQPGWRLNLERELALCSDVPVSLQRGAVDAPEQTTEAGYLMALVRRLNGAAGGSAQPQPRAQGPTRSAPPPPARKAPPPPPSKSSTQLLLDLSLTESQPPPISQPPPRLPRSQASSSPSPSPPPPVAAPRFSPDASSP